MRRLQAFVFAVAALALGALPAVGLGARGGVEAGEGVNLNVLVTEMAVAHPASVAAGKVTFVARNKGAVEHELVVVRGTAKLPVKNFKADENGRDLGEIEDIEPGKTKRLTLTLVAGKYLLLCNIVGHYQLGMRSVLTVR